MYALGILRIIEISIKCNFVWECHKGVLVRGECITYGSCVVTTTLIAEMGNAARSMNLYTKKPTNERRMQRRSCKNIARKKRIEKALLLEVKIKGK